MHKGYAFVQFTNPFDARNACHGEDGRNILSQVLGKAMNYFFLRFFSSLFSSFFLYFIFMNIKFGMLRIVGVYYQSSTFLAQNGLSLMRL